jgi:hypothetical protein
LVPSISPTRKNLTHAQSASPCVVSGDVYLQDHTKHPGR